MSGVGRRVGRPLAAIVLGLLCGVSEAPAADAPVRAAPSGEAAPEFLLGADVSSLDRLEVRGVSFDHGDSLRTALAVLRGHGFDTLRLSVLVDPATGFSGLGRSVAMGARIKGAGFRLFLDLECSDAPTGAGIHELPRRWKALAAPALADTVKAYAQRVVTEFGAEGAKPDLVQIGREIGGGFLGDVGSVGPDSSAAAWDRFATLLSAGIAGVHAAAPRARIVLHFEGGRAARSGAALDSLRARDVGFDLVGVSWYPWYHGTLAQLKETLDVLAAHGAKDVLVLETAYPWTLDDADDVLNEVSQPSQLHPGYAATPAGQRAWVAAVIALARSVPAARGVFYEEPTNISAKGVGSSWDNLALFDADGGALPALDAIREAAAGK
ncbi:MAG: glycosyl hydrolase 53 family protein [bacterium]